MCQYFSCIITKDLKVHWSKKSMAHEDLLAELKVEDKKLEQRDFVRIEISPKIQEKITRNSEDWDFKVDEERTLPEWYEKNVVECRKLCWEAWERSVQINIALENEKKQVTDTVILACGSSQVEACGSSQVEACGSSQVEACGSSQVVAYGSSQVVACGSSKVEAYDSSKVEAYDSSKVEIESSCAIVLCYGKIFVNSEAEVIRASTVKASEVV